VAKIKNVFSKVKIMPLHIVATPIGNFNDMTLRGIEALKSADLIIGEELKEVTKLVKNLNLGYKNIELLNEHSNDQDLKELVNLCIEKNVALVSDCGTPAFCDPGVNLINKCRKLKIPVFTLPGASSLMTFISGCGEPLKNFYFRGFLSANSEERLQELNQLKTFKNPIVLMDTPYRLNKLLSDIHSVMPQRRIVIGTSLTQENEKFFSGTALQLLNEFKDQKLEFVLSLL
jgi:16S rRNA (cytidine1402-2'-O)-methyltransferase